MPEQPSTTRPRRKVLLVEDSAAMQNILTPLIRAVPGLVLAAVAVGAAEAIAAYEVHRPDVIVLDLALRESNGLSVLLEIKRRAQPCSVLVFTCLDDEVARTRCLAAGADGFFSKTKEAGELMQRLHFLGGDEPLAQPGSESVSAPLRPDAAAPVPQNPPGEIQGTSSPALGSAA